MMFSNHITQLYKSIDRLDDLERIKESIKDHNSRFISKIQSKLQKPESLIGENGLHYLQRSLFRSKTLIEGFNLALNHHNVLTAILATRAHFEITGGVAYFNKKLMSYQKESITYEQLNDSLYRLSLGGKIKELEEMPDPINVMSLIDAIDYFYQKNSKDKEPAFRKSYDRLSEFCHPNSFGLFMASHVDLINREITYNSKNELNAENNWFVSLFLMSITTFIYFYDHTFDLLSATEEFPNIFR